MLCYRCGGHVKDGSDKCESCGQTFALGLKPGPVAGFGTGSRRHRVAIEGTPYRPGDSVAVRYLVKDHVGAGPVGWVYRVTDTEADVDVALKVISPRFLQMPEEKQAFFAAMQKARGLAHPNLARVYEFGEDQERPFIASQFLEGLTLRRIMDLRRQKGQGFSLKEVEPIVAQIAAALEAADEAFAHGDLKPDNVIVLPDLLKLTDFGLATSLPRAPFMAAQKAGGVHRYLAPEFLLGEKLDARTDVYALGVMVGELLAGAQFDPSFDLLAKNPSLPRAVQSIFKRAVAQRAGERFPTAVDLADELSELLETGGQALAPRPAASRPPAPMAAAPQPQAPMAAAPAPVASAAAPAPLPGEPTVEAVIEEEVTDPRVRIARALAAQDEQLAEARRAAATASHSAAAAVQIPGTLQTLAPEAPVTMGGKNGDAAAIAARIGATPELLTADTAVKVPPTAPPEPLAAAPAPAPEPAAASEPAAAGSVAEAATSEEADEEPAAIKPRRGSRGRRGKEQRGRKERVRDPEWTAAVAPQAPAPAQPAAPAVIAQPPAVVRSDPPSFGRLVEKPSRLTVPVKAMIGLGVVMALLAIYGLTRSGSTTPEAPKAEAVAKEEPKKPEAKPEAKPEPKAAAEAPAKPPVEPKKEEPQVAEAPMPAAEEKPKKSAAAERRDERAARKSAAEERKRSLTKKMRARREARAAAKAAKKRSAPSDDERRRAQEEAIKQVEARRAEPPTPAPAPAAPAAAAPSAAAPAPAAAPPAEPAKVSGGIAGVDDGDLLASKPSKADAPKVAADAAPAAAAAAVAVPGCPTGMQKIPGGKAFIGSDPKDDLRNFGDRNLASVELPAFCIDQYEFPNRAGSFPRVASAFAEADALCGKEGKRLCSEDEWEKACKGPGDLRFPYGPQFDAEACNTQDKSDNPRQVGPIGAFRRCRSAFGVFDLSGNVAEWTSGTFEAGAPDKVVKGGNASRPAFDDRCASRRKAKPGLHDIKVGFRCCGEVR